MKNLKQIALDLCLKDTASFANFFVGSNVQLVKVLGDLYANTTSSFVYFWGNDGAGKSHLLSALCQSFGEHDLSAAYLPLEDIEQFSLKMLDDLEMLDLLCIDDLNLIAGNSEWEEKIFHCFNKMIACNKRVVITANVAPPLLLLKLLDLKSRMMGGLIFSLQALSDEEKVSGLKLRAKLRGLELPDIAAHFLLNHYKRDSKNLFAVLEKLDKAALAAQRKLTIPFIKDVLDQDN
ncbi:MAG: DnaA regulatory inactivator Hda [Gammaproteobacteria bacterium]|nr:DnaA regulatory inactivator Hda [Gammaproteobacteria bacterium]